MIGENSILLNTATMKQLVENYLNNDLFSESQLPVAVDSISVTTPSQSGDVYMIYFKTLPPISAE